MDKEILRRWCQDWVWGNADHECGGLEIGNCSDCDQQAMSLMVQVEAVVDPNSTLSKSVVKRISIMAEAKKEEEGP